MSSVLLNEAAETDTWLHDYLESDATLMSLVSGVFSQFLGYSQDPTPLVRFFLVEQDDLMVVNAKRVWSELVYQVEGVTRGPDATAVRAIARRIDELLHRHQGDSSLSTVFIQEIFRRQPLFRRTVESGTEYLYAGGEYVVRVSPVV
jgi:hypothetical protein